MKVHRKVIQWYCGDNRGERWWRRRRKRWFSWWWTKHLFFQWELKQNNLSQKLKLNSKTKRQARKGSKKNPDLIFKEISQKIQNACFWTKFRFILFLVACHTSKHTHTLNIVCDNWMWMLYIERFDYDFPNV